jgi:hypothetical protein
VARQLHAHLPAIEIMALLQNHPANQGRRWSRKEIEDAVTNSIRTAWQPYGGQTAPARAAKWPAKDDARIEAIVHEGAGLADLWEASPVRIEDNGVHTEEIIVRLFPGNVLICAGRSQSDFDTRLCEHWRGQIAAMQFIVPSPMSVITGVTKKGKQSKHTLANTGPRRFLVCEFDAGDLDQQAALILHLATFAPLVCALHSGGKSLHAWFLVHGQPDAKIEKFFRYAVSLGADPATWTRSQFVRMPDSIRDNGKRQTVYFLNFKPLELRT